MGKKKINKTIRSLIENSKIYNHRSMIFILGQNSRFQVVYLHHLLKLSLSSSSVLWCFQKELGFSMHNNKRIRQLRKQYQSGSISMDDDVLFDHFLVAEDVHFCHYSESDTVLGQTVSMAVLQDFDALTPNIIARITETVQGGGLIVFLLPDLTSLSELSAKRMHVHVGYETEAHPIVSLRFNNRFVLSLHPCKNCLVLDDELKQKLIPCNLFSSEMNQPSPACKSLSMLKQSQLGVKHLCKVIDSCLTADQAKALVSFYTGLTEKNSKSVTALTSARGRGKSATMGLSVALAMALKYSSVFLTSPHLQNLSTLFTFLLKGLEMLDYKEDTDYTVTYSTNDQNARLVSQIEMFKSHHQIVKYVPPTEASHITNADLVVIDEAAAIPLPLVKKWIGPFKVFMASTINGYEGTGRSLSLKLISHLRKQSVEFFQNEQNSSSNSAPAYKGRSLCELTLSQPIRYNDNDPIETWLNDLLCLDAAMVPQINGECPDPQQCQLYYVNKDALFSFRKAAEKFLQNSVALFVSSHYKNSPNDLLMLADAPAYHVFCLLSPIGDNVSRLPDILCVIQVALEGRISKPVIESEKSRSKRGAGDLIPWIISQQFLDDDFICYSGARIVRIATHPELQKMGYGLRSLQILLEYYKGAFIHSGGTFNEENRSKPEVHAKKDPMCALPLPHMLMRLEEREPEMLDYVGVSYGLTYELLRFWKKTGFIPLYIRQIQNEITAEHSCVMVKELSSRFAAKVCLPDYWLDFSERFATLLNSAFSSMPVNLAFEVLTHSAVHLKNLTEYSGEELKVLISKRSLRRLEMYCQHLVDYHLILDLLPVISKMYFLHRLNLSLPHVQAAILLCLGLQNKSLEDTAMELDCATTAILGLLTQIIKKILNSLNRSLNSAPAAKMDYSKMKKDLSPKNHNTFSIASGDSSGYFGNAKSSKRQIGHANSEDMQYKKSKKL